MDYARRFKNTDRTPVRAPARHKRRKKPMDFKLPDRKLFYGALAIMMILSIFIGGRYYWREGRWNYIVIHHTASARGSLKYIRHLHRKERGWSEIAYHFVVNNGTENTSLGQIEPSVLWEERRSGHSTKISKINTFGIAVVMVGNFENRRAPLLQKESLVRLVTRLAKKYNIPPERIIGHRDVQHTKCPGKYLKIEDIRKRVKFNLSRGKTPARM